MPESVFADAQADNLRRIGGRLTRRRAFRLLQVEEDDFATSSDGWDIGPVPEKVHLLLFGSPSYGGDGFQRFYDILLQGAELQPCREALENACHSVVLPEAALMLLDETSGT